MDRRYVLRALFLFCLPRTGVVYADVSFTFVFGRLAKVLEIVHSPPSTAPNVYSATIAYITTWGVADDYLRFLPLWIAFELLYNAVPGVKPEARATEASCNRQGNIYMFCFHLDCPRCSREDYMALLPMIVPGGGLAPVVSAMI